MRPFATLLGGMFALLCRAGGPDVAFTENRGQWPEQVLFRANIPGGVLFVETGALTYVMARGGPLAEHGHVHDEAAPPLRMHAYRVTFEGAAGGAGEGAQRQPQYENYFLGNEPSHWGSGCAVYGVAWVRNLYPGVDLRLDGRHGLKYDLIVAPGTDPGLIRMRYAGQDGLSLIDGALHVALSTGEVVEEAPASFVERDGITREVTSAYVLHGNTVGFHFCGRPAVRSGAFCLQSGDRITIDPTLTFASYTGSTADNFGCTATYDDTGHLYGGGIVFGIGYPITLGVLQPSFAGATIDMGLTKWSPDGTSLVWSTYLGGFTGNETPHSLVVNDNDELFVLGTSGSSDFPVPAGCYDPTFGAGPALIFGIGYGYSHVSGCDVVLAHLNNTATALIGATYIGGSNSDGVNNSPTTAWNYGDSFRGEVALDPSQRPVVATCTASTDIPTTPGAPMTAYGGGDQDGYVFRMDAGLTTLQFATYFGGSATDAAYGVQFDSAGDIYVTGGTNSANLPMAGSPFDATFNGTLDGWIAHFAPGGPLLVSSTYVGTSAYDQCYFVQLDPADQVYVVGQTHGAYPVTPGKYTDPGSSQFIHKFSADLSTSSWSTVIGAGTGAEDISPGAFLVSDCGQIYFSGWGGLVNTNAQADLSTTFGLPVTAGAIQSTTDGSDFWLIVLEPEATALNYATFFGGPTSLEHVDGGTSRFDKNGNVYQAVCAGCGGNDDFPTTPGAWSNTNNSFNCNLGVFKMALSQPVALIDIAGPDYLCMPNAAVFDNLSSGGTSYLWYFGDGDSSTVFEPTHVYADTGIYVVMMILSDSSDCTPSDTAYLSITVLDGADASVDPPPPLCDGDSIQLHAYGGTDYLWYPSYGLSDTTIADPWASPDSSVTYYVIVSDSCGSDTASVTVVYAVPFGEAGPDAVICLGDSVTITADGGGSYLWSPATSLSDPTAENPWAFPTDTTIYVVEITTPDGCIVHDSLTVTVQFDPPEPVTNDTAACEGGSVQLQVSGGDSYLWQSAPGLTDLSVPDPVVTPPAPTTYYVTLVNACAAVLDSVFVDVITVVADAWPDTIICPGQSVTLFASGGTVYDWSPAASLSVTDAASTVASPTSTTTYTVVVSDPIGCDDTTWVTVEVFPAPSVYAGEDVTLPFGGSTTLHAIGTGTLLWSPDADITCIECPDPTVFPETSTEYTVQITDTNGCTATDAVYVIIEGTLYVPNTFTPDGDGVNDLFFALGTEIDEFKMYVFNRWGEKIYEASDLQRPWDGTYSGVPSPIDTYVWRIDYRELSGTRHKVFGHVNLVR